jgi:hypothetical protein
MVWFAHDSALEGDGFEPSVPVAREPVYIAEGELEGSTGQPKKFCGVPMIRIHLPPAESRVRTRLGPQLRLFLRVRPQRIGRASRLAEIARFI